MNQRLDIYDIFPSGMTEYLSRYGWHVRVFYAVTTYWTNTILRELERIGCTGE